MLILNEFEQISGLGCNVEKTVLMQIGKKEQIPQEIKDIGFDIKNEIVLLGAKIKNTGLSFESNVDGVIERVRKQVNFWKRFNLSLPGRINVAKTFMYSQINYLGCILPFHKNLINRLSTLIENFVKGNLKVSQNRIYLQRSEGGLGLFNLADFLAAQCVSWVKRALIGTDLWKENLKKAGFGDALNIRKHRINKKSNPILFYIAECYEKFLLNMVQCKKITKKW